MWLFKLNFVQPAKRENTQMMFQTRRFSPRGSGACTQPSPDTLPRIPPQKNPTQPLCLKRSQLKTQRTPSVLFTFPDSESFPPFTWLSLYIWVWAHPALRFLCFLSRSGFECCPGCVTVAGDESLVSCQQKHPSVLLGLATEEVVCCCCLSWGRVGARSPESHHAQPCWRGEGTEISSPSAEVTLLVYPP